MQELKKCQDMKLLKNTWSFPLSLSLSLSLLFPLSLSSLFQKKKNMLRSDFNIEPSGGRCCDLGLNIYSLILKIK